MNKTLPGITLALVLLGSAPAALAQTTGVGIGTTAPDASAALDIVSSGKGVLLPRVASAASVASPAPGLLLYQTGSPAGFYYNAGTAAAPSWQQLATTANGDNLGNHTATQSLNLAGNFLIGTGDTVSTTAQGLGVRADGGLNLGQNNGHNVVLGFQAGGNMMPNLMTNTGINNTLVGYSAGRALTTGYGNVFSGLNAGRSTTSGTSNVFSGANAGLKNTTGSDNVLIGVGAGTGNTTGASNVFLGPSAGSRNTTGNNNLYLGNSAGYSNVGGSGNIALGYNTASAQPSATNTVVVGYNAQLGASGLSNATAIGYNAVVSQSNSLVLGGTGGDAVSVGIGTAAPATTLHVAGTAGTPNVRLGSLGGTGTRLVTADANGNLSSQAIPASTPSWNLSGNGGTSANTNFIGTTDAQDFVVRVANAETARFTQNGGLAFAGQTVALGGGAGAAQPASNTNLNVFVGFATGGQNVGRNNAMVGGFAGRNSTGSNNTLLGAEAAQSLGSGDNNTAVGNNAMRATSNGSGNVALGNYAGGALGTGTNNTFIGSGADAATSGATLTNATAIGSGATVGANNALVLGGTGSNAVSVGIGTTVPTSVLDVRGALALPYTTTGSATSFTLTAAHQTVRRFGSCATITVPNASTCAGRLYTIINSNGTGSDVALPVAGGTGIYDDVTSTTLTTLAPNNRISIQSDGSGWIVVGR